LYAIKYERKDGTRYYRHPNERDLENENKVKQIVRDNIVSWQEQGLVPSMEIESGMKTEEVIRTRGWTHWNHLFNARQLLILSKIVDVISNENKRMQKIAGILGLHKCIDWDSRLCRWNSGSGNEKSEQTFYNQAFNTMMNWGTRSLIGLKTSWFFDINNYITNRNAYISLMDAREVNNTCHLWITDPPFKNIIHFFIFYYNSLYHLLLLGRYP